ncbi:hypothetical protein [Candidatus Hepatoplasma crinochetorum]|uniref:hypothetical protein n=1 Tax=Candidatus Hepatoplasma crinochetorum TaxID=295596 RepID=UPI00308C0C11|nr:MAG: hypothetical protein HCTKY_1330 [Candidatus Hepatoplasma crinochetorum]
MKLIIILIIIFFIIFLFFKWLINLSYKKSKKIIKPKNDQEWQKELKEEKKDLTLIESFENLLQKYDVYQNSISLKTLKELLVKNIILYNRKYKIFYKNEAKFITRNMHNKIYGIVIYIIYFDISSLNNKEKIDIIPCYIGQSKNITNRWIRHINHLQNCKKGFKTEIKYNKILKFAKDYNLNLDDLNFAILKKTKFDNLNETEDFFIDLFKSDEHGRNWLFK